MDTHKKQHKVALLYAGDDEIIEFVVKNTASEIKKMVKKIKKQASGEIKFCYEAGVSGLSSSSKSNLNKSTLTLINF